MLLPQVLDVSGKGQMLIPVGMRMALGIKTNGQVWAVPDKKKSRLMIAPVKGENIIKATYGMLASGDGRSWTRELMKEKRRDLAKEEK